MTRRKTIFITGASSGIGAACAVGLAERGYRVFAGVRKPADGERLERAGGGNISAVAIDVTDPAAIDSAAATLRAALDGERLDALFNNAGIAVVAPLECVPLDELRRQLEVNVVGTAAVTQALLPLLRAARGRVITTGSIGGFISSPLLGPYCMSKYALEAFNDALRLEVAAQGIEVILLEPGTISTGMKDKCDGNAKALRERAPAHCAELYDQLSEAMMRYGDAAIDRASDPQVVLNAVIDAIESPNPKTRYLIGHSARLQSLLRRLPDQLRDRVILGGLRTMTAKTVQQAPSQTALGAAFYRAMAHRDATVEGIGSDHLASAFLSGAHRFLVRFGWLRRAIRRKSERVTPGIYEYMLARTAFFDERYARALDDGTEQIVLLGAGYDTRPRRMPSPDGLKVIELDIAPTQERKRVCLGRAGLAEPAGLVFAPIDFNTQSIATVLREAGYDPGRKTLFLWEGVTYYLTGDAVDDVLRLVRENTHPETTIAFDHAITLSDENIDRIHGARTFTETWRKHRKDEPIRFFIDQGALPSFLGERGLDLVEHLDASEMESTYCTGDARAPTGKVTGFFRLAVARPAA